jgi:Fic family protein
MLLDRRCRFLSRDEALHRIRADYLELPGLRLTAPQAARLWGLALETASDLLEELVARKFLVRLDEQYCLR